MQIIKTNKKYYVLELLLIISCVVYMLFFFNFYKDAAFYVDKKAGIISQLHFFTTFYLSDILIYLFVAFLLITIQMLFLIVIYSKMRGDFEVNRELTKLFIIAMFTFCSYSLGLFFNRIGVLFLIIFIFSAAIAYLKYIVVKSDSDEFGTIEEENILEVAGPFNTESEAINLFGEFSENWDGSEELLYLIERESNEEYFITIYVETVQKSEER